MIVVLKIFLAQAVVFGIIIFMLKGVLDKMLIENAMRDFNSQEFEKISQVTAVVYKPPTSKTKDLINRIAKAKFGNDVQVVFEQDSSLWGGIKIRCGRSTIDYSLINKLKAGGFIK